MNRMYQEKYFSSKIENAENKGRRLVPDHFLFFKKNFICDKSKWSSALSQYI